MKNIKLSTAKKLISITDYFNRYIGDWYECDDGSYPSPYQEEVIEWIWKKHKIHIEILVREQRSIDIYRPNQIEFYNEEELEEIKKEPKPLFNILIKDMMSLDIYYEQQLVFIDRNRAMEEGIKEALKIIKNKRI